MSDDIVDGLRVSKSEFQSLTPLMVWERMHEAADEIEQLRALLRWSWDRVWPDEWVDVGPDEAAVWLRGEGITNLMEDEQFTEDEALAMEQTLTRVLEATE
jgi:hypothetical protein